jgi:hypothetical protein
VRYKNLLSFNLTFKDWQHEGIKPLANYSVDLENTPISEVDLEDLKQYVQTVCLEVIEECFISMEHNKNG